MSNGKKERGEEYGLLGMNGAWSPPPRGLTVSPPLPNKELGTNPSGCTCCSWIGIDAVLRDPPVVLLAGLGLSLSPSLLGGPLE